jgi:hypothetical protein
VTAVACVDSSRLAAATGDGIAVSNDGGATWRTTAPELGPVLSLAFVAGHGGEVLLAGPATRGVARTEDFGRTWALLQGEER